MRWAGGRRSLAAWVVLAGACRTGGSDVGSAHPDGGSASSGPAGSTSSSGPSGSAPSSGAESSSSGTGDLTAPVIRNLREERVTPLRATVCLDTDEPARVEVRWGVGETADHLVQDGTLGTAHCLELADLVPRTVYAWRATATDAAGNAGHSAERVFTTPATGAADVEMTVDGNTSVHAISPFIYGRNARPAGDAPPLVRAGGNRWTAYNWENNASNAGNDWNFQNDGYLVMDSSAPDTPGQALREWVEPALAAGASVLLTVPVLGYVAADKQEDGDVRQGADYLGQRFDVLHARKDGPLLLAPDRNDHAVYVEEMVHWVEHTFPRPETPGAPQVFYSLDNEPDLWASTHAEVHPDPVRYAEVAEKSVAVAQAIRAQAPAAKIFGPAVSGWYGLTSLGGAPDAAGRDFLAVYLDALRVAAGIEARLLDVLDVHWYPEARGGGVRITEADGSPEVAAARVQAPRALWDPLYRETSWIQDDVLGPDTPIRLLPRLADLVDVHLPTTPLALTEYSFGGGEHISGALAQADALGVFGRENLWAACHWQLGSGEESFTRAAFALYRNFDGAGGHFGSLSVGAVTADFVATSIYAGRDADAPGRVTLVVINKTEALLAARITLRDFPVPPSDCAVYQLTAALAQPVRAGTALLEDGAVYYEMPASSASLLVLSGG